jgi:hypothetical protein
VNGTRGTYWIVGSIGRCGTPPAPKTAYERAMEALEAEEDVEREEDRRRNQQEDDAKRRDESTPWLKHHTKWPTRFKGTITDSRNKLSVKVIEALECLRSWHQVERFDLEDVAEQ